MMERQYKYMVCTRCRTYNQALYIKDALDGFCMQETTFPVVNIIIDDASTDGEQEVISQYLRENFELEDSEVVRQEETDDYYLTFTRHKNNYNCYFVVVLLKYNHYKTKDERPYYAEWEDNAKYIALCEGDDFWTHPQKLQMEVEALEKRTECGMCYTAYRYLHVESGKFRDVYTSEKEKHDNDFMWRILSFDATIGTATVLLNNELYKRIKVECADDFKGYLMGDTQTWFHFARLSVVHYIPIITTTYRKHRGSITGVGDAEKKLVFERSMLTMRLNIVEKYGAPEEVISKIKRQTAAMLITSCLNLRRYEEALAINKEILSNSAKIGFMIRIAEFMKLRSLPGIGRIIINTQLA